MFAYGIIGANGPIEGVSISSPAVKADREIVDSVVAHHGGDVDKHMPGVHKGQLAKRIAQDGVTETRLFPMEG